MIIVQQDISTYISAVYTSHLLVFPALYTTDCLLTLSSVSNFSTYTKITKSTPITLQSPREAVPVIIMNASSPSRHLRKTAPPSNNQTSNVSGLLQVLNVSVMARSFLKRPKTSMPVRGNGLTTNETDWVDDDDDWDVEIGDLQRVEEYRVVEPWETIDLFIRPKGGYEDCKW